LGIVPTKIEKWVTEADLRVMATKEITKRRNKRREKEKSAFNIRIFLIFFYLSHTTLSDSRDGSTKGR